MKTQFLSLLIMIFFVSCQHKNAHQHDEHDHSHDNVTLQFTQYDSTLEIFAEAGPFAAGHSSEILLHISKVENFKPIRDGKVTASLIVGSKGIRQTLDKPFKPGIYRFVLTPEMTGAGKLIFDVETPTTTSSFEFTGITVYDDEHDAIHEAEHHMMDNPNAVSFTKEQSWKVDFATGTPVLEPFGKIIYATALVQPSQSDEVTLSASTNGIVQFTQENLTEGAEVVSGKTLMLLSGEKLADNNSQVRYNEARNNFEKAEANFTRLSELAKDRIVSEKELLEAKSEYENARIRFENMKRFFGEEGQQVTSSMSGFINRLFVSNGQHVEAGDPLLTISRIKDLYLKADVQQKYMVDLSRVRTANIVTSNDSVLSLERLNGKIVSYGKSVSDNSFLIPVTIQIENHPDIVPGSFLEVFLKTESATPALTVPNTALVEEQGNFAVYVQLTPESFVKREVKTGNTDGVRSEVLSGLEPNERIVTRGGILVKLSAVSNSLDPHAGHVH